MNLRDEMAKLPQPTTDKRPPNWEYWRQELWRLAQEEAPENFTKWPCVYHTMLQNHWPDAISWEYWRLPSRWLPSHWQGLAAAPQHLTDYSATVRDCSLAMVHQLYHLYRWQDKTNLRVDEMDTIYEFGGGFGAMALACRRLGFAGEYIIYDLPEFSLLQQWFLAENGVEASWPGVIEKTRVDLIIACYSLSEVDFSLRNDFLRKVQSRSNLFLYSNKFEDFDNIHYFSHLPQDRVWQHEHLEHLPPESWYTFGSQFI